MLGFMENLIYCVNKCNCKMIAIQIQKSYQKTYFLELDIIYIYIVGPI